MRVLRWCTLQCLLESHASFNKLMPHLWIPSNFLKLQHKCTSQWWTSFSRNLTGHTSIITWCLTYIFIWYLVGIIITKSSTDWVFPMTYYFLSKYDFGKHNEMLLDPSGSYHLGTDLSLDVHSLTAVEEWIHKIMQVVFWNIFWQYLPWNYMLHTIFHKRILRISHWFWFCPAN